MTTKEIAEKLVTYCRQGKFEEAQVELYSKDAISIEPEDTPTAPKETKGLAAIIEKGRRFSSAPETAHSIEVSDPMLSEGSFACMMKLDATMKGHAETNLTRLPRQQCPKRPRWPWPTPPMRTASPARPLHQSIWPF